MPIRLIRNVFQKSIWHKLLTNHRQVPTFLASYWEHQASQVLQLQDRQPQGWGLLGFPELEALGAPAVDRDQLLAPQHWAWKLWKPCLGPCHGSGSLISQAYAPGSAWLPGLLGTRFPSMQWVLLICSLGLMRTWEPNIPMSHDWSGSLGSWAPRLYFFSKFELKHFDSKQKKLAFFFHRKLWKFYILFQSGVKVCLRISCGTEVLTLNLLLWRRQEWSSPSTVTSWTEEKWGNRAESDSSVH